MPKDGVILLGSLLLNGPEDTARRLVISGMQYELIRLVSVTGSAELFIGGPLTARYVTSFLLGSCVERSMWFKRVDELPRTLDELAEFLEPQGYLVVGEPTAERDGAFAVIANKSWKGWWDIVLSPDGYPEPPPIILNPCAGG